MKHYPGEKFTYTDCDTGAEVTRLTTSLPMLAELSKY